MLCEKCQNLRFSDSATAAGYARANDFKGSHQVAGVWFPGKSKEDLEKCCAKNCSIEAKPAQAKPVQAKPVQDTNVNHSRPIVKSVAPQTKPAQAKKAPVPDEKAKGESTEFWSDCVDEEDKPSTENKDKNKD